MGRHTKLMEDLRGADAPVEQPQKSRGPRSGARVPLLPMLALVIAIALVGYAWTTKQISLNFAGGAPAQANKCEVAPCGSSSDQSRASRGKQSTVAVTVRMTSRMTGGFHGTATLVNRGAKPVKGWTLAFRMSKAKMVGASGAVLLKSSGSLATFRGTSVIAPGQAVRLVFTGTGQFSMPSACHLVNALCRIT